MTDTEIPTSPSIFATMRRGLTRVRAGFKAWFHESLGIEWWAIATPICLVAGFFLMDAAEPNEALAMTLFTVMFGLVPAAIGGLRALYLLGRDRDTSAGPAKSGL